MTPKSLSFLDLASLIRMYLRLVFCMYVFPTDVQVELQDEGLYYRDKS